MTILNISPILLNSLFTGPHMIWLLVIVLVLFGGKKIPELAKGIGKGIREFNEAKDGIKTEIETGIKEKDKINSTNA